MNAPIFLIGGKTDFWESATKYHTIYILQILAFILAYQPANSMNPTRGIFCASLVAEFQPHSQIQNGHIFPNTMSDFPNLEK